ncbi:unnamed protein product [Malus baccata var. baccata]
MIWDTLAFNPDDMRYFCSSVACLQRDLLHLISPSSFLRMSGPSDRRFDLNFGEEAAMPSHDMTVAMVARNLPTPKDNKLISKWSDELAVKDSLALSRFVGLFQRHLLPLSSGAVPRNEAPNDQPSVPPPSRVLPSTEAPNNHPLVSHLSGALQTAETSSEQPL